MIEILIGLLLLWSGNGKDVDTDPEKVISRANNEFSFKIFNILSKNENDVISSLSILSALSKPIHNKNNYFFSNILLKLIFRCFNEWSER